MPTFIQNVLEGRPCANVAIWRIAVNQLKGVLDRLEQPSTKIDKDFVRDLMEVSEADARLSIQAETLAIDVEQESNWLDVDGRIDELQAVANAFDNSFEFRLMSLLRDKNLLPADMMDFEERMYGVDED